MGGEERHTEEGAGWLEEKGAALAWWLLRCWTGHTADASPQCPGTVVAEDKELSMVQYLGALVASIHVSDSSAQKNLATCRPIRVLSIVFLAIALAAPSPCDWSAG